MTYLLLTLRSRLASFRDPETQNYHRTLPLPPPSTCIGIAGAALGLNGPDAQAFFTANEWEIGISGTSGGMFRDLWKYDNFDTGSIIWREYLYENEFRIVFGHPEAARLAQLEAAFRRPVYALTCGNSDNVCLIDWQQSGIHTGADAGAEEGQSPAASPVPSPAPATPPPISSSTSREAAMTAPPVCRYGPCYLPGDALSQALAAVPPDAELRVITGSGPTLLELPVRYEFLRNGERMTTERRRLTYVRHLTLPQTQALHAFTYRTTAIPLFPL